MSWGTPVRVTRVTRNRARRSILAEIAQDLFREWARASQARSLVNARRAATAASAAGVERAEIESWFRAQHDDPGGAHAGV